MNDSRLLDLPAKGSGDSDRMRFTKQPDGAIEIEIDEEWARSPTRATLPPQQVEMLRKWLGASST